MDFFDLNRFFLIFIRLPYRIMLFVITIMVTLSVSLWMTVIGVY